MKIFFLLSLSFILSYTYAQDVFTSSPNSAISDDNTENCFTITVSSVGTINSIYGLQKVCINIDHTWDSDLDIYLVAPDGTRVELTTDNGSSGDNYKTTCFNMEASTNVTSGSAPFDGTYVPEGDLNDVNNGQNADGDWKLCITDDSGGDNGTLNEWSLTFDSLPQPPTNDLPCSAIEILSGSSDTASNARTTDSGEGDPGCADYDNTESYFDLWYYTVIPANGDVIVETSSDDGSITDTGLELLYGDCNNLCKIECDDDDGTGYFSKITVENSYPGDTIWIRVWERGCDKKGTFVVSVSSTSDDSLVAAENGDCRQANTTCSNEDITSNSTGSGNLNELNCSNKGTLIDGEHYSTWLFFGSQVDCEICLTISSADNTDYDFAIWNNVQCNPQAQPIRCSYADDDNYSGTDTGLKSSSTDVWEEEDVDNEGNATDGFVKCIQATAGQEFTMVIDNYSGNGNEFTLTWDLCQDDALDCSTLPVEFIASDYDCSKQLLSWSTKSEFNNNYFTLKVGSEYLQGLEVENEYQIIGNGNSNTFSEYNFHTNISNKFMELWQTDYNGVSTLLETKYISCPISKYNKVSLFPNPSNGTVQISGKYHSLKVYDILGKEIVVEIIDNQILNLKPGIYSVLIDSQDAIKLIILK